MPARQHTPFPVTWNQVAAFRLARHHLSERTPTRSLLSVTRDMTGAQAQLLSAAQISLWSRVREIQVAQIEKAIKERKLVKATCMRQTLFLVPARDLAIFVRGTTERAEKEIRWALGKGVPERTVETAIEAALGVLDKPLTRPEIAERVCRALGVQLQTYEGGGWGNRRNLVAVPVGELNYPAVNLLQLAGARGVVCYGPYRGNEPTFVRADAWIPKWRDIPREQAEERLLRLYLRAFGPATAADFAQWAGLSLTNARRIWTRRQGELAPVTVDGWSAEILREDLDKLSQAALERPQVRLLPFFDTFLLGHRERQHLVSLEHHPEVYRPQGWIAPVVLVNGRVAAVWQHSSERDRLLVKVSKFAPLKRPITAGINEEAQNLGRFLGTQNVEVQVD